MGWWPPDSGGGVVPGSIEIGGPVIGGTPPAVLFINALGELDQDPLFFGYDKASHTLTLKGTSPLVLDAGPLHKINDGVWLQVTPSVAHGAQPSFWGHLGGAAFDPGAVWNPVWSFGSNIGPGGLPVDPAFGTAAFNFEGNFQVAPGLFQPEIHWVMGKADGTEQLRILSASMRKDTGHAELASTTDIWAWVDAADLALAMRFRGLDSGSKAIEFFVDTTFLEKADHNSPSLTFNAGGGTTHIEQAGPGSMNHITFTGQDLYYANAGGPASHLFRTGVTMGGTGDRAVNVPNLTLVAEGGQTAPMIDLPGATAIAFVRGDLILIDDAANVEQARFNAAGLLIAQDRQIRMVDQTAVTRNTLTYAGTVLAIGDPTTAARFRSSLLTVDSGMEVGLSAPAAAIFKMTKTAIVPIGALARFKVQDETGAVFYLTGQAA
jgi:hypothetical protein